MAYNQNIPQPTDLLSVSQGDLLNNFMALQTLIDINHVDFASGDQGKHKFVTFPVQGAAPVFLGGEVGLYNLLPGVPFPLTGQNELFINKSNGTNIPITASAQASPGWTYLPSGLVVKWGTATANPGSTLITFPANVNTPAFTNIFTMLITPIGTVGSNFNIYFTSALAPYTQFTVASNSGVNQNFNYFAIGI